MVYLLDLFQAHGIDHLVIPTRDYLFAPSFVDINRAVQFIHCEFFHFLFNFGKGCKCINQRASFIFCVMKKQFYACASYFCILL
jgi:atypical dual specificity phosphatase